MKTTKDLLDEMFGDAGYALNAIEGARQSVENNDAEVAADWVHTAKHTIKELVCKMNTLYAMIDDQADLRGLVREECRNAIISLRYPADDWGVEEEE